MDDKSCPPIIQVLKEIQKPIRNVNVEHKRELTTLETLAVWITNHVGTMGFFLIILFWTLFWLSWNTIGPASLRFDPFPAFAFWLFISNMIQIFLMPLIMVGQNLQNRHAELKAEADYEANTKVSKAIEAILVHVENQNEVIMKILNRLEKDKTESNH
jgi:uncharacterized membrane protein